jgi:hypothetical protein
MLAAGAVSEEIPDQEISNFEFLPNIVWTRNFDLAMKDLRNWTRCSYVLCLQNN